ncbi:uncharacterized protein LOC121931912 isoform X1 [Sceloporus undulatus]|uniref:uncharacterized protein LOC121931912 isoform X1 n=1 Tax=Sceloporus undulatus TaxID=8520 RepID=UPI001C4BD1E3|nr:uncharacterized protein LOC121931912 isoform X1 [Sceloporus undulatus]
MLVKGLLSQPGFLGALRRLRPKRGLLIPGQTWAGAPSRMSLAESNAGLPEVQPCCHKATAALKEEEKSPPGPDPLPAFPSPGASVMRVSRTVHLYRPPGVPSGSSPLVLLLPWFGAPAHALAKYLSLYVSRGWMVLVAESSVGHFLWPRWGLDYAAQVLGLLREGGPLGGHPLLIHAFSIGGYTFAQMMVHLAEHPEEYASVRERIRGLIYDSLVAGSLADMARECKTSSLQSQCLLRTISSATSKESLSASMPGATNKKPLPLPPALCGQDDQLSRPAAVHPPGDAPLLPPLPPLHRRLLRGRPGHLPPAAPPLPSPGLLLPQRPAERRQSHAAAPGRLAGGWHRCPGARVASLPPCRAPAPPSAGLYPGPGHFPAGSALAPSQAPGKTLAGGSQQTLTHRSGGKGQNRNRGQGCGIRCPHAPQGGNNVFQNQPQGLPGLTLKC